MNESQYNMYDVLISDENIYLAIYSIDSYIFDKEILEYSDYVKLNKLRDKFDEQYIQKFIRKVRKRLKELINDSNTYIKAKVYFNPKRYEKLNGQDTIVFRPIHIASLTELVAIVSMLNMFIYEVPYGDKEITLSNLSRLIPNNFYGNRVSTCPESLFKPWKTQYRKYTQKANEKFRKYYETKQYQCEVDLDLVDFFPSVNPKFLYQYILSFLPVTICDKNLELYKKMLIKLLVCQISNLTKKMEPVYYEECEKTEQTWSVGIPQGLPQSYFLGNICMIEISKIFNRVFEGDSLYYVDDSVIFTNKIQNRMDFIDKIEQINHEINDISQKFINENDEFFRIYNDELSRFLMGFSKKINVHNESGKSSFTRICNAPTSEIYLKELSREASQVGGGMFLLESDQEGDNLCSKIDILLEGIVNEKKEIESKNSVIEGELEKDEQYLKKLDRYQKFFKYRKIKLNLQKQNIFIEYPELEITEKDKNFAEKFVMAYKNDVWRVYTILGLEDETNTQSFEHRKKKLCYIEKKLSEYVSVQCSYVHRVFDNFFIRNTNIISPINPYESLLIKVRKKLKYYEKAQNKLIYKFIKEQLLNHTVDQLMEKKIIELGSIWRWMKVVRNSSFLIQKMVLNTIYSYLFQIDVSDELLISKKNQKMILYGELRLITFLRNPWLDAKMYNKFSLDLQDENNLLKIDYSIMEVLETFLRYVKNPIFIDNLILIHQYTCDVWKNGSKYLYFYTLHNQEHAVDLIKNCIRLVKAIDFIRISSDDYYILFVACYLHDISMVKIPSEDEFLLNEDISFQIVHDFSKRLEEEKFTVKNTTEVKPLILDVYKKIDEFFENVIRSKHAIDSAREIRTRSDLGFLESNLRENIANIAEAHMYDVEDIYCVKSDAKNHLVSLKFDKILLRMADLLDMSNYRVSKPILNHNINQMSPTSAFHWISHLLTKGYRLEVQYCVVDEKESILKPKNIQEKIILHIDISMSQMSQIEINEKCNMCAIDLNSISLNGFKIRCGERCESNMCNFLCKWFSDKNSYLLQECAALKAYLGRTPTNYYSSDFVINLNIVDKTKLDEKQFEILKQYLINKNN